MSILLKLLKFKTQGIIGITSIIVTLTPVIGFAEDAAQKQLEGYGAKAQATMVMIAGVLFSLIMTYSLISMGIRYMSDPENVNMRKSLGLQVFGLIIGGIMIFQSDMIIKLITSIFK